MLNQPTAEIHNKQTKKDPNYIIEMLTTNESMSGKSSVCFKYGYQQMWTKYEDRCHQNKTMVLILNSIDHTRSLESEYIYILNALRSLKWPYNNVSSSFVVIECFNGNMNGSPKPRAKYPNAAILCEAVIRAGWLKWYKLL